MSTIRVAATANPPDQQYSFIFLHGLGDSLDGWRYVGDTAREEYPSLAHVNFVFPHAPTAPSTVNMGEPIPQWFDIKSLADVHRAEDATGIGTSLQLLQGFIEAEMAQGVPLDHVIIGGFLQGCALSLLLVNVCSYKLAGVVGLGGFTPLLGYIKRVRRDATICEVNKRTPVFIGHGDNDKAISVMWAEESSEVLHKGGFENVTFRKYPGVGHTVSGDELGDVFAWLEHVVRSN